MRKAIFYSLDAAVALFLILSALVAASMIYSPRTSSETMQVLGNDLVHVLSTLTVEEAQYDVFNNVTGRQAEESILEYAGELWALGKLSDARAVLGNVTSTLLPKHVALDISFENQNIFATETSLNKSTTKSSMTYYITGVAENETVKGVSARTYITGVGNKPTSSFLYFGGFEGQGNISKRGLVLPADANVINLSLEMFLGAPSTLKINGALCRNLAASPLGLGSSLYDASTCIPLLLKGQENIFSFEFSSIESAFVGGGFINAEYTTSSLIDLEQGQVTYALPGVEGIINLFSSFPVPGNLTGMEIMLHYDVNHSDINNASLYMVMGNSTVYNKSDAQGQTWETLDNQYLSSILDYDELNDKTVPLRLGIDNLTYTMQAQTGNADVVLITDLSGSMYRCIDNQNSCSTGCPSSSCRIDTAKDIAKDFADKLLAVEGNRIGLVTYSTNANLRLALSENESEVNSTIDSFTAGGSTCISCAVRESRMLLQDESNLSRNTFIIVMTDGIGNIETDDTNINDTSGCGYYWCGGRSWCGNCADYTSNCEGCMNYDNTCSDYISNEARDDAVDDACYAHSLLNTSVYAVGFGIGSTSCDYARDALEQIAICGNGKNYTSSNVTGLYNIYTDIADQIILSSTTSQVVSINGANVHTSLFDDSYITLNYTSKTNNDTIGYMQMTFSSDHFGVCNPVVSLPDAKIRQVHVTSFSSIHWTDALMVNGLDIFNLSTYGANYARLGDPFYIDVPVGNVHAGNNDLLLRVGDSPQNASGCSPHARMLYTISLPISVETKGIFRVAKGCAWNISYYDGTTALVPVPSSYVGPKLCQYTPQNISYDMQDAIDSAVYELFKVLDIDDDNDIDVKLDANGLEIETSQVSGIPGLWGPARFTVGVGK